MPSRQTTMTKRNASACMRLGAALLVCVGALGSAAGADGQVDESFFADQVYPLLESAQCRTCHSDNGVASPTRLHFPESGSPAETVKLFGLRLSPLVDAARPADSLLLTKPTQRIEHTGGKRITPGSEAEKNLRAWIDYLAGLSDAQRESLVAGLVSKTDGALKQTVLRRLTHSQYNNTVRDLLGDFTRPADQFPPEDFLHGFTNQAAGQTISPLQAEAYTNAGEKLAANAFRQGDSQGLIPCKSAGPDDAACRDRFLREFGLKAFRRPLSDEEVGGYAELFASSAIEGDAFLAGAKVVVEAMLQSPSFLFHLEEGPAGSWPQYEAASRLSYFLWDTMPDEELLRAAESGQLSSEEEVETAARRMLEHARAKQAFGEFLAQWMRFDRVRASVRSVRVYKEFNPTLLPVMTEETRHLFNYLVWQDRDFTEFFDADYTFLPASLAKHYNLPAPAEEFGMVKYPAGSSRAGILGQAGFLTLTGTPSDTSPTSRGLFVRERLLCQDVPPPPPGVDANLPPVTGEKPMTNRDRMAVHLASPSCSSCHNLIDPIGFGFEQYDNIGLYREKLILSLARDRNDVGNRRAKREKFELDFDTRAHIQGLADSEFTTVGQLGGILADSPVCQRCVVKQIFRYALGRHENAQDQPYIDALFQGFRDSGFKFRELAVALAVSEPFMGSALGDHGEEKSSSSRLTTAELARHADRQ